MNSSTTLLEYLTCANPQLRARPPRERPPASTVNKKWPRPEEVVPWRGFTADAIRNMFEGRLQQHLEVRAEGFPDFSNVHPECRKIFREQSLDSLIGKWHQSILLEALERTSEQIIGQKVYMVKGDQALLPYDDSNPSGPDWAGTNDVQREDQFVLPNNILPGDTKTSWNWTSDELMERKFDTDWPLRQLLFYCIKSCSRYGYLITNEELVIIRVSRYELAPEIKPGVEDDPFEFSYQVGKYPSVEFLSIPWSASGDSDGMTMNLALWVLHILAANNGRLQAKPYDHLDQEKCIPREKQVAIRRVSADEAKQLGRSAKDPFEEQSYKGSFEQGAAVGIAPDSDTEDETQGDITDNEDPIHPSQQNSFVDVVPSAKRKRASIDASSSKTVTTSARNSRRNIPEQHSRDSSRPRRSARKKVLEEKQRCRVPSSSRTRA